jgi:hypothetical protein
MRVCDEQQFPSERDPGVVRSDWRETEMCMVYMVYLVTQGVVISRGERGNK